MKKAWKKPKLVGLYRGRSDEAVLSCCKSLIPGDVINDPAQDFQQCKETGTFACACCNEVACT